MRLGAERRDRSGSEAMPDTGIGVDMVDLMVQQCDGACMPTICRVALYARVSTQDQNPQTQLCDLRRYAERRGWEVVSEYVGDPALKK